LPNTLDFCSLGKISSFILKEFVQIRHFNLGSSIFINSQINFVLI
jgi:hypothetical protein